MHMESYGGREVDTELSSSGPSGAKRRLHTHFRGFITLDANLQLP